MEPSLTFAADRMLGRLATWLRLIGIDTLWGPQWSGAALIRVARTEHRTVLTRDSRTLRVDEPPPMLFIESDHFRQQLHQVLVAYAIDPYTRLLTRCSRCNEPLVSVATSAVATEPAVQRPPEYVLETQPMLFRCRRCQRFYWPATHVEHVRRELAGIVSVQPTAAV